MGRGARHRVRVRPGAGHRWREPPRRRSPRRAAPWPAAGQSTGACTLAGRRGVGLGRRRNTRTPSRSTTPARTGGSRGRRCRFPATTTRQGLSAGELHLVVGGASLDSGAIVWRRESIDASSRVRSTCDQQLDRAGPPFPTGAERDRRRRLVALGILALRLRLRRRGAHPGPSARARGLDDGSATSSRWTAPSTHLRCRRRARLGGHPVRGADPRSLGRPPARRVLQRRPRDPESLRLGASLTERLTVPHAGCDSLSISREIPDDPPPRTRRQPRGGGVGARCRRRRGLRGAPPGGAAAARGASSSGRRSTRRPAARARTAPLPGGPQHDPAAPRRGAAPGGGAATSTWASGRSSSTTSGSWRGSPGNTRHSGSPPASGAAPRRRRTSPRSPPSARRPSFCPPPSILTRRGHA